ncbi:hypothetical protein T492DRAFT_1120825 [Pavlovales sp. CCMP2436]|nr:hypothetical protein T492DRAFT_1120825 [Pavlovales sp. CCMP2436]
MWASTVGATALALPSSDLDEFYEAGLDEVGFGFRVGRGGTSRVPGGAWARAASPYDAPSSREAALEPSYALVRSSKPSAFFGTAARLAAGTNGSAVADGADGLIPATELNPSIDAVRPREPGGMISPPPSAPAKKLLGEQPGPGTYGGFETDRATRPRSRAAVIPPPPPAPARSRPSSPLLGKRRESDAAPADAIRRPVRGVSLGPGRCAAKGAVRRQPAPTVLRPPPDVGVLRRTAPAYSFGGGPRVGGWLGAPAASDGEESSSDGTSDEESGSGWSSDASPVPVPRYGTVERRATGASFGTASRFPTKRELSDRLSGGGSRLSSDSLSELSRTSTLSHGATDAAMRKGTRGALFGTEKRKVAPRASELALELAQAAAEATLASPSVLTDISDTSTIRADAPDELLSTRTRAPAALIMPERRLDKRAERTRQRRECEEARRAPGLYGDAAARADPLVRPATPAAHLGPQRDAAAAAPPDSAAAEAERAHARALERARRERAKSPGPGSYDPVDGATRAEPRAPKWVAPPPPAPAVQPAEPPAPAEAAPAAAADPFELDRATRARVLGAALPRVPRDGGLGATEGEGTDAMYSPAFGLVERSAAAGGYLAPRGASTVPRARVPTAAEARLRAKYGPLGSAMLALLAPAAPADVLGLRAGRGVVRWHGPLALVGPAHPPLRRPGHHELGIDLLMPDFSWAKPRAPAFGFGSQPARPAPSAAETESPAPGPSDYAPALELAAAASALGVLLFARARCAPFSALTGRRFGLTLARAEEADGLAARAAAAPAGAEGAAARVAAARARAARAETLAGAALALRVVEAVAFVRQSVPGFRMVSPQLSERAAHVLARRAESLALSRPFAPALPPANPRPPQRVLGVLAFGGALGRLPLKPAGWLTAELDYSPDFGAVEAGARAHAFARAADAVREHGGGAEAAATAAALEAAVGGLLLHVRAAEAFDATRLRMRGGSRFADAAPRFVEIDDDEAMAASTLGPAGYGPSDAALRAHVPAASFGGKALLEGAHSARVADADAAMDAALRPSLDVRHGLVERTAPAFTIRKLRLDDSAAAGPIEGDVLVLGDAERPRADVRGAVEMARQGARPEGFADGGEGADVSYDVSDALVRPRVPAPVDMARALAREPAGGEAEPLAAIGALREVSHAAVERAVTAASFARAETERAGPGGGESDGGVPEGALLALQRNLSPVRRALRSGVPFAKQGGRADAEPEPDARPLASPGADAPLRSRAPAPVDMARAPSLQRGGPELEPDLRAPLSPKLHAVRPTAPAADFSKVAGRDADAEPFGVREGDVLVLGDAKRPRADVRGAVEMARQSARPEGFADGGEGADVSYDVSDALVRSRVPAPVDMARAADAAEAGPIALRPLEPWYEPSFALVEKSVAGSAYARRLDGGREARRRRRVAAALSAAAAELAAGGHAPLPPPPDDAPPPPPPPQGAQPQPGAAPLSDGPQSRARSDVLARRARRRAAAADTEDVNDALAGVDELHAVPAAWSS